MTYQMTLLEKEQAAMINRQDRKYKKIYNDIKYSGDTPAVVCIFDKPLATAGHSQTPINPSNVSPSVLPGTPQKNKNVIDERTLQQIKRDPDCIYKHCTLGNCISCKRLK